MVVIDSTFCGTRSRPQTSPQSRRECRECCSSQHAVTWDGAHLDTEAGGRRGRRALRHLAFSRAGARGLEPLPAALATQRSPANTSPGEDGVRGLICRERSGLAGLRSARLPPVDPAAMLELSPRRSPKLSAVQTGSTNTIQGVPGCSDSAEHAATSRGTMLLRTSHQEPPHSVLSLAQSGGFGWIYLGFAVG